MDASNRKKKTFEATIRIRPIFIVLETLSKSVLLENEWVITLTSYDTSQTLDNFRLLLFRSFPDITSSVHQSQTDISFETLKVNIPDPQIYTEQV